VVYACSNKQVYGYGVEEACICMFYTQIPCLKRALSWKRAFVV
jgi:hypothetical protein